MIADCDGVFQGRTTSNVERRGSRNPNAPSINIHTPYFTSLARADKPPVELNISRVLASLSPSSLTQLLRLSVDRHGEDVLKLDGGAMVNSTFLAFRIVKDRSIGSSLLSASNIQT